MDWDLYIVSIAKTASKKIEALIRSMKFLSPEVFLYLYKSTTRPCMEYCCRVWAGTPRCYMELLHKLFTCLTCTCHLPWNLGAFSKCSQLIRITLKDFQLNWLNWFRFLIFVGGPPVILTSCMIFLSLFLDVNRMSMSIAFSSNN